MLDIILGGMFKPKNYLPTFALTPKLMKETDKLYLQFITDLFLSVATKKPPLSREDQMWFLEEIAFNQKLVNPELSREEHIKALQKIVIEFDEKRKEVQK